MMLDAQSPAFWRNDRPPTEKEVGPDGKLWVYHTDIACRDGKEWIYHIDIASRADLKSVIGWFNERPRYHHWADGNFPVPQSAPQL